MIIHSVDVAVIGGGPAGLASAISAKENGAKNVIIIDRNNWLGGILPQCIHDGFGIEETGFSMTGPEYAEMYIKRAIKENIEFFIETMVLSFNKNLEIIAVNKKGLHKIKSKSIVLAMGCREKTRWNIMIPGDRPSGIFTAGVAQTLINLYNIMPGSKVVILGSGDVGLIMARRLFFEGADVIGVIEILPYSSGLPRNVVQCLDDYGIPLFLNHTITNIRGQGRLESITIAQVDEKMNVIANSERKIKCDTLLLSLGLIPENELSKNVDIEIDDITGGPIIDESFQTSLKGVYACGNCLQVYDTVDLLVKGAEKAGQNVAKYNVKKTKTKNIIYVKPGNGILFIVPQKIKKTGTIDFTFRVKTPKKNVTLSVKNGLKEIFKEKIRFVNPANMGNFSLEISKEIIETSKILEVSLDG